MQHPSIMELASNNFWEDTKPSEKDNSDRKKSERNEKEASDYIK